MTEIRDAYSIAEVKVMARALDAYQRELFSDALILKEDGNDEALGSCMDEFRQAGRLYDRYNALIELNNTND